MQLPKEIMGFRFHNLNWNASLELCCCPVICVSHVGECFGRYLKNKIYVTALFGFSAAFEKDKFEQGDKWIREHYLIDNICFGSLNNDSAQRNSYFIFPLSYQLCQWIFFHILHLRENWKMLVIICFVNKFSANLEKISTIRMQKHNNFIKNIIISWAES